MPAETILADRVDIDNYDPGYPMVPDGFAMQASLRPGLPKRYRPDAVGALAWLREAREIYYPKWYVAPLDPAATIAAYDTYTQQTRMVPGAYIWGWQFIALGDATTGQFYVQLVDPCTRQSVFQSYVNAASMTNTNAWEVPRLLTQPYKIESQGLLDMQIRNNSATAAGCQLILHVAEPATTPTAKLPYGQSVEAVNPAVSGGLSGVFIRR